MKALNLQFVAAMAVSLALIVLAFALFFRPSTIAFAGSPAVAPAFNVASTSAAVSVTTSTRILATTTNTGGTGFTRAYASICNTSATKLVLISLNGDKPANGATAGGYWLNSNSCYEVTDKMLYQGSVTASTSDQSAVQVLVQDYTY